MHHLQVTAHRTNQLLEAMPQPVMALLRKPLLQVSLSQGFVCFEAGKPIQRVYFPISGLISLVASALNPIIVLVIINHLIAAAFVM